MDWDKKEPDHPYTIGELGQEVDRLNKMISRFSRQMGLNNYVDIRNALKNAKKTIYEYMAWLMQLEKREVDE